MLFAHLSLPTGLIMAASFPYTIRNCILFFLCAFWLVPPTSLLLARLCSGFLALLPCRSVRRGALLLCPLSQQTNGFWTERFKSSSMFQRRSSVVMICGCFHVVRLRLCAARHKILWMQLLKCAHLLPTYKCLFIIPP